MGFTIQDMMTECGSRYQVELVAGSEGWSNSISWVQMVEDTVVLGNFNGRELAVTLGVGFQTEERLLELARLLVKNHASGLMINIGGYIYEIPESVRQYCEENHLPLLTVPWEVYMVDLIHDLSVRVLLQEEADENITRALIAAIEQSRDREEYRQMLRPFFDVDGEFQIILFYISGLEEMDTVIRKKLGNRLSIYLENITHNGSFFYYDKYFVLMLNDVSPEDEEMIVSGMQIQAQRRMPDHPISIGIGSSIQKVERLHIGFSRARAALHMAWYDKKPSVRFDQMEIYRLICSADDSLLLWEMGEKTLQPVLDYDRRHEGCYRETLKCYLENNCSIQAVAEKMYTHRNTIIYRINRIKELLGTDFSGMDDRMKYLLAIRIYETGLGRLS